LNPHALFGHQALNLARLPIPPLRRGERCTIPPALGVGNRPTEATLAGRVMVETECQLIRPRARARLRKVPNSWANAPKSPATQASRERSSAA
jgi:hypothetical protein